MSDISIRHASIEDLPLLNMFEQGVIQAERPFDDTLRPDPITYYDLSELIRSDIAVVIVAVLDKNIIASGYALIKEAKPYYKYQHFAYLGFMYVVPEYRGQGINQLIIEEIKKWCRFQKIYELKLEVYAQNKAAIKAYEKAGFTPNLLEMRIAIEHNY